MTRLEHWKWIHDMEQRGSKSPEPGDFDNQFCRSTATVPWMRVPPSTSHPNVSRMKLLAHAEASIRQEAGREGQHFSGAMFELFKGGMSFLDDILITAQKHARHTLSMNSSDNDMNSPLVALINDLELGLVPV
jgi:hypothetical protein